MDRRGDFTTWHLCDHDRRRGHRRLRSRSALPLCSPFPTRPSPAREGGLGTGTGGSREGAELGYWIGVPFWGCGYATEAARCLIDHAFGDLGYEVLSASARVSNPASRRVLEKCGFQWTGVGLCRIRAISSSVPVDRFRLERP